MGKRKKIPADTSQPLPDAPKRPFGNGTEDRKPAQQGWECPKCGAVMAPWNGHCRNCVGQSCSRPYKESWEYLPKWPPHYIGGLPPKSQLLEQYQRMRSAFLQLMQEL